ncbi:MAG: helix-turn-helix transcriptional regulator [Verrucomicrobiota bacterium]|nr:helix-turn-helix transcriptional regulator [Verrucomicrobiota bacterium]
MDGSIQEMAAQVKAARKKKGLSQRELAAKVGMPQSHISKIEQGLVDLQTSSLIQIARALDLEPVLISRTHLSAVEAIQQNRPSSKSIPAYQLPEGEDDPD